MNDYIGTLIDPNWQPEEAVLVVPYLPPVHEGQIAFPEPGIYFGMPEEVYHAVPALSASGLKKLGTSTMDFWATSWLNPDREERETKWLDYGKAIHAFVLEGEEAYLKRYIVQIDPSDFDGVLVSTDEIKAAIGKFSALAPVQPLGTTKQDLLDQLVALGAKHGVEVEREGTVPQLRERIKAFEEEQPVKPVSRVTDRLEDGTEFQRPAQKADLAAQLLALDPEARVWEDIFDRFAREHEGKTMISAKDDKRIRLAARMILGHSDIGAAFTGGYAEVSVFWFCPVTGVPMKARFDYLKMRAVVDLKSFSNTNGLPVDRAIERAIANYRYNVQHCVYDEAVEVARKMVREHGQLAVKSHDDCGPDEHEARVSFCERWCGQEEPASFIFVFQQSGQAPVTRGKVMPRGTVFSVTRNIIESLKRLWLKCAQTYGTDPWLDLAPLEEIEDERIPLYATELGKD